MNDEYKNLNDHQLAILINRLYDQDCSVCKERADEIQEILYERKRLQAYESGFRDGTKENLKALVYRVDDEDLAAYTERLAQQVKELNNDERCFLLTALLDGDEKLELEIKTQKPRETTCNIH